MFVGGSSLWMAGQHATFPKLQDEHRVDVAIIGGGITGLSAAYFLKQAGKTVAVIERGQLGNWSTGHTTGKVSSQHGVAYHALQNIVGHDAAQAYATGNQQMIEQIEQIITDEKIDCDWRRADNYVFTEQAAEVPSLQQEAKAAAVLGLPASFEKDVPLPFATKGGVKFTDQATFHVGQYLRGLAQAVDGDGSHVFENSRVKSFRDGAPCRVATAAGTVIAKDAIMATNVPYRVSTRAIYAFLEYPRQSYIIAAKLRTSLPPAMYISSGSPTRSILPAKFDGQEYLLIGGQNHLPYFGGGSGRHYRKLEEYVWERFDVESVDYRWFARDYIAIDKLPLAGTLLPWSKHFYAATAFRKWGLTNGTLAGLTLADRILGKETPYIKTFNTWRITPGNYFGTLARRLKAGK